MTVAPSTSAPFVLSLNVGCERQVEWNDATVPTGIYKSAVNGPVRLANHAVAGDHVADLRVHGGPDKAVYAFPSEHYPAWREVFPEADWSWGAFGENLTTEGLLEDTVCIGDRFRCGSAEIEARQPRMPCYKFTIRVGDKSAIDRMIKTRHTGYYFGITREGELSSGDPLELVAGPTSEGTPGLSIAAFNGLIYGKDATAEALRAAAEALALPESWRRKFMERAAKSETG